MSNDRHPMSNGWKLIVLLACVLVVIVKIVLAEMGVIK